MDFSRTSLDPDVLEIVPKTVGLSMLALGMEEGKTGVFNLIC